MAASYPSSAATDVQLHVAVNNLSTVLTSNCDGSQPLIYANTSGFPTDGFISIDNEIIHYTGSAPTVFTGCTRGADGTTGAAHTAGAIINFNIVAAIHNDSKNEIEAIETDLVNAMGAITPVAAASTATSILNRFAMLCKQIQLMTNGANWYTAATQMLTINGGTMTGNIAFGSSYKLTGLAAGTGNGDSLRYEQVIGQFLLLTGGTMSGNIAMGGYKLTGLAAGSGNGDSLRYEQVIGQFLLLNGGTVTGQTTFSAAAGNPIHGTNTNDNASAGYIGEYIESVVSTGTLTGTGVWLDVTSIALTAGDWDLTGIVIELDGSATTVDQVIIAMTPNSGDTSTGIVYGSNGVFGYVDTTTGVKIYGMTLAIPAYRVSIASSTTYYLKFQATYTGTAPAVYGARLSARRMR